MNANSEIPQQINEVEVDASPVQCVLGANGSGTGLESGTLLTQARSRPVRGFVYFISCGDHIKIGFSTRPLDRLRALQTSHPDALEIVGTMRGTRALETKLHKRFADTRERGEWFQTSGALWDYIDRNAIERKGEMPNLSPKTRAAIGQLTRARLAHDPESAIAHGYSNLIELVTVMDSYVRPAWATHESQTVPGMINWQMKRIAALTAAR